ncbi:hypothetical protein Tco_1018758 [Tanacetum coccineum]|uniref:Uncharacterized protein n=1 Tax=Tanacetum coccineum TaxID=301880 RepID=A0ABQ5FWL8_9ASTR
MCDIVDLVMKNYKCEVSSNQCLNDKKYALTEYEKTIEEHYDMLRSYERAIPDTNHGSTIKVGCNRVIALDGCFLKSPKQGEILTGIGRDDNNHIYPMAWSVGLIEAITNVMPYAEYKQCARHIYEGFGKHFREPNVVVAGSGTVGDVGEACGMQTNKRKVRSSLGMTKRQTKKRGCNSDFAKWFGDGPSQTHKEVVQTEEVAVQAQPPSEIDLTQVEMATPDDNQ